VGIFVGERMMSIPATFQHASMSKACYTQLRNDDTDQIHDETARQSRWALGIGLTIR
jgi:hypothetical protein